MEGTDRHDSPPADAEAERLRLRAIETREHEQLLRRRVAELRATLRPRRVSHVPAAELVRRYDDARRELELAIEERLAAEREYRAYHRRLAVRKQIGLEDD